MRAILVLAILVAAAPAQAQAPQRDDVGDALAGHRAEMRALAGDNDPWRRPLLLDPVDVETATVGFSCDHLAARRPDVVAGRGHVHLFETEATGAARRLIRHWQPPGASDAEARAAADAFATRAAAGAPFRLLAWRAFAWCR